ncbi:recombinase family protein [Alishewanella sp. 16-MA]|uniref:Recombinase family protein n=1 Tax=Alishewanella maricola TaxID=2795740 RepID=A0ABS8C2C3_9ALTE|nr:recombinase family protein [Alishewanella maricola]MCB5226486.1 recombinase family protein [Alishewanella maricola]
MIVGYARVSTQDQSLDLQSDALRAAGCEEIFSEKITGKQRERPELQNCLRMLRKGDVLVVWKLDRLARSLKDLVELITELEAKQVGFRSITEAIDTTTAGGKLVFHIFGALAEFEHNLIRERTLAGLAAARARGRKGGRKPSMSQSDIQKATAMLLDSKITKTDVAKHFKVSRVTLNKALDSSE